jgi:hypothetical protein
VPVLQDLPTGKLTAFRSPQRVAWATHSQIPVSFKSCIFNAERIGGSRAICLGEERKETTMESWMSGAMLIEATMLSVLVALWIAWMSLRGLFRMLPATRLDAVPIRPTAQRRAGAIRRHAA